MLEVPTTLLSGSIELGKSNSDISQELPNAIFISCYDRPSYLSELLQQLWWFPNPIYLLPTHSFSKQTRVGLGLNLEVLYYKKFEIVNEIRELKTFNSISSIPLRSWDLPIKRNFAILFSIQKQYDKIAILDDDIYGISRDLVNFNTKNLENNKISGPLVTDFPDTSVLGHIDKAVSGFYSPFLSGNFLFFRPKEAMGFFPLIYNEDWLFMLPSIRDKQVVYAGSILQKTYNPFDVSKVEFQEFGDIIAEGLFELVNRNKWSDRYSIKFWEDYITYRHEIIKDLQLKSEKKVYDLLSQCLEVSKSITATQCIQFITDWESDIDKFEELKRQMQSN